MKNSFSSQHNMSDEILDNVLYQVLNHCSSSYEKFLDLIFSFLYRKTYFFKSAESDYGSPGLPPGLAEEMAKMIFKKYLQLETERQNDIISEPVYLQECREEIVETTELEPGYDISSTPITESASLVDNPEHDEDTLMKENHAKKDTDVSRTYYDSNPECYNGASYDNYSWSQTVYDLDVQIKVPNFITNGKQVKVHISHTHLKAEVLKSSEWEVILDGQLSLKISTEGSVWTLDPGCHIDVHLEKAQEKFWEALLVGEPKINVQTIDCSKPYEDLCEEEQAKIQEVLYDHHQKRLGKPTIKETRVHEILKEAWDKENSPFKDQKFDPSDFSVMG